MNEGFPPLLEVASLSETGSDPSVFLSAAMPTIIQLGGGGLFSCFHLTLMM